LKQRVDLPGVGENYQGQLEPYRYWRDGIVTNFWTRTDHNIMFTSYFAADEAVTLDGIYGNNEDAIAGMSCPVHESNEWPITGDDVFAP
jgi:hypothetical protein